MKNFKKIIYLFLLSIMVVSCGEDEVDSVTNFGHLDDLEQVKVRFNDDNINPVIIEGVTTTSFRLGMPAAVDGEVTVEMEVTSSDGSVEATFINPVVFERGQSEIIYDFKATEDGIVESDEVYTLTIKDIKVDYINGTTKHFSFTGENYSRTITIIEPTITTTSGDLTFNFNWTGSSDLDCRLVDNPPALQYDTGYSTTPGETVTLVDGVPDGNYLFRVRPWRVTSASIDYTIDVVAPTETVPYAGVFENLTGFWSMEFVVLEINKTTIDSTVYYTLKQL